MTDKLSPQMEKLLGLMDGGTLYTESSVQEQFYGMSKGSYGYVNAGRGRGTGSLRRTFKALERRGKVKRIDAPYPGWMLA